MELSTPSRFDFHSYAAIVPVVLDPLPLKVTELPCSTCEGEISSITATGGCDAGVAAEDVGELPVTTVIQPVMPEIKIITVINNSFFVAVSLTFYRINNIA